MWLSEILTCIRFWIRKRNQRFLRLAILEPISLVLKARATGTFKT